MEEEEEENDSKALFQKAENSHYLVVHSENKHQKISFHSDLFPR